MKRKLYGWTLPVHVVFLSLFVVLFVSFVVLAVVSASLFTYTPFQWVVMAFLTLSAGLSAAWELRVVYLMREGGA
jgi:hypothetical protein